MRKLLISVVVVVASLAATIQAQPELPMPGERAQVKSDVCKMPSKPAAATVPTTKPTPAHAQTTKPAATTLPTKPPTPKPAPPKGRRKRAAGQPCWAVKDLEPEIQQLINKILNKRKEDIAKDKNNYWENNKESKCLFNETDIMAANITIKEDNKDKVVDLSHYVQVPKDELPKMTLWSGINPPYATRFVDDQAMRLESTKLGFYLFSQFPSNATKEWPTPNWPSGFVPDFCHWPWNWDSPEMGKSDPNTRMMTRMPLFRILWMYASKNFAKQLGNTPQLKAFLSASGGSKGGIIGDTFNLAEYPEVKAMNADQKKLTFTSFNVTIVEDPSITYPVKYNCSSVEYNLLKQRVMTELFITKENIHCKDIKLNIDDMKKLVPPP